MQSFLLYYTVLKFFMIFFYDIFDKTLHNNLHKQTMYSGI